MDVVNDPGKFPKEDEVRAKAFRERCANPPPPSEGLMEMVRKFGRFALKDGE